MKKKTQLRRTFTAIALVSTLAMPACSTISTQQEQQIGQQYSTDINRELPMVSDGQVNSYITNLGNQLARSGQRGLNYRFFVVNSDVVNAFAVPGGYVYINRGLIERAGNMSEVAGVLAHEISHVEQRHSVEQMEKAQGANIGLTLASVLLGQPSAAVATGVNLAGTAIFAKYSRNDENEADASAIPLLLAARINPQGLVTMFQRLMSLQKSQPSAMTQWFSTHPTTTERINATQAKISQIPVAQRQNLTTDATAFRSIQQRLRSMPAAPRTKQ